MSPDSRSWHDALVTLAQMGHSGAGLQWVEMLPVTSPGRIGAEAPVVFKSGSSMVLHFILPFFFSSPFEYFTGGS